MKLTSYREVRRLAYLRLICDFIAKEKSAEIHLASKKLVDEAALLNEKLRVYKRDTGKIESISVAKNHFAIANIFNLVKLERDFLESTSEAAFFACLPKNEDNPFFLTIDEKISFWEIIFKNRFRSLSDILTSFKENEYVNFEYMREQIKSRYKRSRVDHTVKSHIEWLIDLSLCDCTSKRKGKFGLTETGKMMKELLSTETYDSESLIPLKKFAETLLGEVKLPERIEDQIVMSTFDMAIEKTKDYAVSEISKELFSALPVIKFMRLVILKDHRMFLSLDYLITSMKELLAKRGIIFRWDPIYEGGYIRT